MVLDLLRTYTFANHKQGTSIALGFGLLLRECWVAVEVEDDDESSPKFLRESLLGLKQFKQVTKVIAEVIGRLPSSDADKERSKEKELDDGTAG